MASIEYTRTELHAVGREYIQFSDDAIQNPGKSEAAGRPIFDSVEMITISFPGNNQTVIVRKVTPEDRERYAKHYEAFKKHGGTVVDGTPLEAWTALTKAQVREFQAMNIFSIEHLANIDDLGTQRIGLGGQMWRTRARIFLEAAEDNAVTDRIAAENFRLHEQIDAQGRQLAELGSLCQNLQAQMQGMQNARAEGGQPMQALPPSVTSLGMTSPNLASGALGEPQGQYIEPKRRGPARPKDQAAA